MTNHIGIKSFYRDYGPEKGEAPKSIIVPDFHLPPDIMEALERVSISKLELLPLYLPRFSPYQCNDDYYVKISDEVSLAAAEDMIGEEDRYEIEGTIMMMSHHVDSWFSTLPLPVQFLLRTCDWYTAEYVIGDTDAILLCGIEMEHYVEYVTRNPGDYGIPLQRPAPRNFARRSYGDWTPSFATL